MSLARLLFAPPSSLRAVRRVVIGLACAATLLATPPARASLILALDTPTMVQRADHIAVVDVVSVKAAWNDSHDRIMTTIDLAVVETWKGPMAPASHIKVVQPGGSTPDMTMVVYGMSRFVAGERALVFLEGTPESARVVGMAQGKRLVSREAASGRWFVHVPDRSGASFIRITPATSSSPPIFDKNARPLDDVRTEVRDLVAKANAR
jgi:hypothetical protein